MVFSLPLSFKLASLLLSCFIYNTLLMILSKEKLLDFLFTFDIAIALFTAR